MLDELFQVIDEMNVKLDLNVNLKDDSVLAFSNQQQAYIQQSQDGITEITSQPSNPKVWASSVSLSAYICAEASVASISLQTSTPLSHSVMNVPKTLAHRQQGEGEKKQAQLSWLSQEPKQTE